MGSMSLLTYVQDHANVDIHTAVVITPAEKFFVGNGFKKCSKDREIKPRDYFSDAKNRTSGKRSQCRSCASDYYVKNKERIAKRHRESMSIPANRAARTIRLKNYHAKRFFYSHAQGSSRRKDTYFASPQELWSLWKRQRGICPLTGIRLNRDNSELDHIVPWKLSRDNSVLNLRWVYGPINRMKHHLLDAEFFELCRMVTAQHPAKAETKEG